MVGVGLPLAMSGLLQVPVKIAENVTKAVAALFDNANIVPLLTAVMSPIVAPINAFGASVQDVVDALGAGHLADAITAVLNVPARLVGAVLNGYTDVTGGFTPGLLTVSDNPFSAGLLQAVFVNLPRAIATAIGAAPAASATATLVDRVASPVSDATATVTLTVAPSESGSAPTEIKPVADAASQASDDAAGAAVDATPKEEAPTGETAETPGRRTRRQRRRRRQG